MTYRASRFRELLQLLAREATPFVQVRIGCLILLVATAAILTALAPVALKLLVDSFASRNRATISPALLIALFVVVQWLARTAAELQQMVYGRIERRMVCTLSEHLFVHLMHLPLRFHLDRQTGAVSETLASGLDGFQLILHHLAFTVLPVTAELVTVLVVLWRTAPPVLLAVFCAALICYAAAFAYSAATLSESARAASSAKVEVGAAITDSLLNYETVKYFAAESLVQQRVATALSRGEIEWATFYHRYAWNGFVVASIFAAFIAASAWCATIDVNRGLMTIGTFVLVITYMLQLAQPVERLGYAAQGFTQGLAMLERMLKLFREAPEPAKRTSYVTVSGRGSVQFSRVSLSYRSDRPVLSDISFRIPPKRTLGIVGSSGSGKSTIVRLLMRLLDPDTGEILFDDAPISSLSLQYLRSAIAVVPQDTILFNDSLAYNIAFGRANATPAEIREAARVAHLHDFVMSLPDGYDTRVGERGVKLSGGEKQRVSIARAVLKSPKLHVFDEATSSLDTRTEQNILASLCEIARHSSTLVIAHRLSTVVHADEIIVLEDGRIVESGAHSALLHQNGRYAALWRAQHPDSAAA